MISSAVMWKLPARKVVNWERHYVILSILATQLVLAQQLDAAASEKDRTGVFALDQNPLAEVRDAVEEQKLRELQSSNERSVLVGVY